MPPSSNQAPAGTWTNSIHHNVLLLVCIVIGGLLVTATLLVALFWFLRLACCAGERRAQRKRKADREAQSPAAIESGQSLDDRHSLDSVTVIDDLEFGSKEAKIDALLQVTGQPAPVLTYTGAEAAAGTPRSTWNGRGWTLFDPPVPALQVPEPATRSRGGYGTNDEQLADRDVEGFPRPAYVKRQSSFIERLLQRHYVSSHLSSTLPPHLQAVEEDRRSRLVGSIYRWLCQVTEASEACHTHAALSPQSGCRCTKMGSIRSTCTSTTLADTISETCFATQAITTGVTKSERLLERIDAAQADYDHQQRRGSTAAADRASRNALVNVNRAPSIRTQFFTTTTLASWLEPTKVATTPGFMVLEEDVESSVVADPFAFDAECIKANGGKLRAPR